MKGVAEAPGKVIISGEHFVVHGATALAAAIERKVRVEAVHSTSLFINSGIRDEAQLKPVRELVKMLYKSRGMEARVSITIFSDLVEGSGLGSSAATMVATVSAVGALEGWRLDRKSLVAAATAGEKLVHGRPSGIDAMASAAGGIIVFRRDDDDEPRQVEPRTPITLLVTHSGRRRNTGELISRVSKMKESYPALFEGLCDSATLVSGLCAEAIAKGDVTSLGRLITYNHAVLGRVGASNRGLDALVDACLSLGCLGAKLTGAGGGGSVLAVPPPTVEKANAVKEALVKRGYETFFTTVPVGGARAWTE